MYSEQDTLAGGLPHSEIPGSTIARISPGLIAACHALHRLSVPRHPPDALKTLDPWHYISNARQNPPLTGTKTADAGHRPARTFPAPCVTLLREDTLPQRRMNIASRHSPPASNTKRTRHPPRSHSLHLSKNTPAMQAHCRQTDASAIVLRPSRRRIRSWTARCRDIPRDVTVAATQTPQALGRPRRPKAGGGRRQRFAFANRESRTAQDKAPGRRTLSGPRAFVTSLGCHCRDYGDNQFRLRRNWWAREDLNLRPHAYQARALTN